MALSLLVVRNVWSAPWLTPFASHVNAPDWSSLALFDHWLWLRPEELVCGRLDWGFVLNGLMARLLPRLIQRGLSESMVALSDIFLSIWNRPSLNVIIGLFPINGIWFISHNVIPGVNFGFDLVNVLLILRGVEVSLLWRFVLRSCYVLLIIHVLVWIRSILNVHYWLLSYKSFADLRIQILNLDRFWLHHPFHHRPLALYTSLRFIMAWHLTTEQPIEMVCKLMPFRYQIFERS